MSTIKKIFNPKKYALMRAYKETFLGDDEKINIHARKILQDLERFCRARVVDSVFDTDTHLMALKEGRREVFNHMVKHLKSNKDDCYDIIGEYE